MWFSSLPYSPLRTTYFVVNYAAISIILNAFEFMTILYSPEGFNINFWYQGISLSIFFWMDLISCNVRRQFISKCLLELFWKWHIHSSVWKHWNNLSFKSYFKMLCTLIVHPDLLAAFLIQMASGLRWQWQVTWLMS